VTDRSCHYLLLIACVHCALPVDSIRAQPDDNPPSEAEDASDPDDDAALLQSWWEAAGCLQGGQASWDACGTILSDAIGDYPESKHAPRCKSLLADIRLTAEEAGDESPPDDLTAARLDVSWLYQPLRRHIGGRYEWIWDTLSEPSDNSDDNPLVVWFKRGRPAVPDLMALLDDQRVTRSVSFRRSEDTRPVVLRVSDVALGLIEGISRCRFNTSGTRFKPFSLMNETQRRQIQEDVRRWWEATSESDPVEAIVWLATHSPLRRAEMAIQVLLATGYRQRAITCRATLYRDNGRIFDNRGDFSFATRLLRAGSREPLDDLHTYIEQGHELQYQHVRMVGEFGEASDAAILESLMYREGKQICKGKATGRLSRRVANALSHSDNAHCVPVVTAIIVSYVQCLDSDTADRPIGMHAGVPRYVVKAGLVLQTLIDADFGLVEKDPPGTQITALRLMAEWWKEDGQSIYGTQQHRATAPAGVR